MLPIVRMIFVKPVSSLKRSRGYSNSHFSNSRDDRQRESYPRSPVKAWLSDWTASTRGTNDDSTMLSTLKSTTTMQPGRYSTAAAVGEEGEEGEEGITVHESIRPGGSTEERHLSDSGQGNEWSIRPPSRSTTAATGSRSSVGDESV